jgi:cyclophilin family peptidyl-prolyl cis-trans isomerase
MPQVLTGYARELGLDGEQFRRDLDAHTYQAKVMGQYQEAVKMGLPGTPSFIVNGRMYPTDQWGISYQGLNALISLALLEPRLYSAPPAFQIDPIRRYVATIRTPKGEIAIELYAAQAPLNVNSFIFLAREGWYNGTTFFRVIPNFVVQAGDPTGTAAGTPGFQCDDEIGDLKFDAAGVVGIANAGPNTGSSQFFITLAPQPDLDGHYTIIGKVVKGLEILQALPERNPADPTAPPGLLIEGVQIEEH